MDYRKIYSAGLLLTALALYSCYSSSSSLPSTSSSSSSSSSSYSDGDSDSEKVSSSSSAETPSSSLSSPSTSDSSSGSSGESSSSSQEAQVFTVTWENYNGDVLEVDEGISEGTVPTYDGAKPKREDDSQTLYLFSGWSPELEEVESDQTYVAQFDSSTVTDSLEFAFDSETSTYQISGYNSSTTLTELVIPAVYDDGIDGLHEVTSIGYQAFQRYRQITSVEMSDNIKSIGDYAFNGDRKIASIRFSENVSTIGVEAFVSCGNLTAITLPDTMESIGADAFAYTGLTAVKIPEGVTTLEKETFEGCSSLTDVSLPSTLTEIGENAFHSCTSLG